MEKTEVIGASAEEGASAVKGSARVQDNEEMVTATEAEAAPMEEHISIVAEGDAKRTQERVFEPEIGLVVKQEPLGSLLSAPTEGLGAVASKAPEDPIMEMTGETSELVEEVVEEVAPVEGKEALMADQVAEVAANVEESLGEAAEIAPTMEIVEESSVEAEPAPKVEIVEEVVVIPGEEGEAAAEPEAALAVEEPEFRVPPKHAVFLSHSGEQKDFVRRLSVTLKGCFLHPFFDLFEDSLPIGENFGVRIFDAIKECHVGVVILSEKYFTSKWPMLELVAMVDRAKRTKGLFKILPIFYSISTQDIDKNRSSWISAWNELAKKKPEGVDVEKWVDAIDYIPKAWDKLATQKPLGVEEVEMYEAALDYIRPINGLKHDRKNDLELENKIVDAVCQLAPQEIRLDDSHVQGRDRLCKVIQDKIVDLQKDNENGVSMVGLYGMHGFGKTSICKALCNKYNVKFRGRVCHAELGRGSEEDLMREVVKKLTSRSQERLKEFKYDELRMMLKEGIVNDAVFLAIDNMMNTDASIGEARQYLSARLPRGSIVMVTAHSKDSLMELRQFMDERNCLQMPELMEEEAKLLFIKSCGLNELDGELVNHCIKLCNFEKGDNVGGCHYHPLALHVLGKQFEGIDPKKWGAQLDKIDEDIFNQRNEDSHPIFSILRRSFDTLSPDDQLLYMDVVLFVPGDAEPKDVLEWLGLVHSIPKVDNVLSRLERLKAKSLLETLGDGVKTGIRMHDLWHKFCVAETEHGKLKHRRWVYEVEKRGELVDTSPSSTMCRGDAKRMAFLDPDVGSLEGVNFSYFPNVTVLKITDIKMTKKVVLDLSALTRLKSLEITGSNLERLVLLGLPRGLHFLLLDSLYDFWKLVGIDEIDNAQKIEKYLGPKHNYYDRWEPMPTSQPLIKQITRLKDLKFLVLGGLGIGSLPDMRSMVSMRAVGFGGLKNAVTVSGLSSKMTNLRELEIFWCRKLRSCPGVGDLVNLEILRCKGCYRLKRLPNLQKLRKLRILDIRGCPLITELPGLGDLEALEKLYAGTDYTLGVAADTASYSIKLPDMRKLSKLRVLRLSNCFVVAVSGFENLISVQKIEANFHRLLVKPNLRHLTKLLNLQITGWGSEGLEELSNLTLLHSLQIRICKGVDKLPGLQNLENLEVLNVRYAQFMDFSSLSNLSPLAMKELIIAYCKNFKSVPDLQRLTGLEYLDIRDCPIKSLTVSGVQLPQLKTLYLVDCKSLKRLTIHKPMNKLSTLVVMRCTSLTTLPDLCNEYFPALEVLSLKGCSKLTTLSSSGLLTALQLLDLGDCSGMEELPDPSLFPALEELSLKGCSNLTALSCSGPLPALQRLYLDDCSGVEGLPDLNLFPALKKLCFKGCSTLTTLGSSAPLLALEALDVRGCESLSRDDIDRIQASCPHCKIVSDAGVVKTWMWKAAGAARRMILALGSGLPI